MDLFLITEITTFSVNQRVFLDMMKMRGTIWEVLNGMLMWLGFLIVRVLITPFIFYLWSQHWDGVSMFVVGTVSLTIG